MSIDRTYRCDLCRDVYRTEDFDYDLVGIYWQASRPKCLIEKPAKDVEHHICAKCVSSIQAFKPRCGQGFECTGGPACGSDHK